jgi:hypothetical protein
MGSHVEDAVDAFAGCEHGLAIGQIAHEWLDSQILEFGVSAPTEGPHSIAASDELFGNVETQKPSGTSDQSMHHKPSLLHVG